MHSLQMLYFCIINYICIAFRSITNYEISIEIKLKNATVSISRLCRCIIIQLCLKSDSSS